VPEMVNLVIDGKPLQATEGQTILEVALAANIYIPTLCHHPKLQPFGACRMCLVKVEGMRNVVPACTTPVAEGMKVTTKDAEIDGLRQGILELILSEHPSSCIVCEDRELCFKYHREPQKAGACTGCRTCPNFDGCELFKVAERLGVRDIGVKIEYKNIPVRRDDPFLDRDYNICILCGRCVRVCSELRGEDAIAFTQRSQKATIGTAFDRPLLESGCVFCGACVDTCPTGALSEKRTKWGGKPDAVLTSTCLLCPVGCAIWVDSKYGRVINVRPTAGGPSGGQLCALGRFCIPPMFNAQERLEYPLVRKGGALVPVGWDEALAFVAARLKSFKPDELGFVVSPALTNEAGHLLQKLARTALGTGNLLLASRLAGPYMEAFPAGAPPRGTFADLAKADTVLVVGSDLEVDAPVLAVPAHQARRKGASFVAVGKLHRRPRYVDMHVEPASLHSFIAEVARLAGPAPSGAAGTTPGLTGGEREKAAEIARALKGKVAILFGGQLAGPDAARTIALLGSLASSTGGTLLPIWDGGNVQGMLDVSAAGSFGGNVRALYLTHQVEKIPDGAGFVVLQDVFRSALMDRADAVLPAAAFTETEGTATSLEGRVQRLERCAAPPRMALPDWEIFARLGTALGAAGFGQRSAEEVRQGMPRSAPMTATGHAGGETLSLRKGPAYRGCPVRELVADYERVMARWEVPR